MKQLYLVVLTVGFLTACGSSEKRMDKPVESTPTAVEPRDSLDGTVPVKPTCKAVISADKLDKANTYSESAKPIMVAITLQQDGGTTEGADGCYFNNSVTILATKKSGSRIFKRTLLKDDLLYFIKTDAVVERSVLKNVVYKPTFNGQKYITVTMQLVEPGTQKTSAYTVFMNYFGEIVKVK